MSCHFAGVQPFKDDVRPVVRELSFASFDREKALAIYPTQETLDHLTERDRRRFEQAAEQLGALSISAQAEPINALTRRFLAEMPVVQAAAESGLETAEFQTRVASSPRMLALGYGQLLVPNGGIKRDAWDRNFGQLARELGLGDHVASVVILPRRGSPNATNPVNFRAMGFGRLRGELESALIRFQ